MSEFTEEQRFRFEQRLKLARAVSYAKAAEQKLIGDKIEMLLWEAKSAEACEVLVDLAHTVFGPRS